MREYIAVLVVVALILAPSVSVAAATDQLEIKPGTLSVSVVDHLGKAMPEASLKLMGSADKVLNTVKADKKGKYALKDLKAGSYKLLVAGRIMVAFNVSKKAKVAELLVVVPAKPKYAAGQKKDSATFLWAHPILLAGLIAVAIAIPIILHNRHSGHGAHP